MNTQAPAGGEGSVANGKETRTPSRINRLPPSGQDLSPAVANACRAITAFLTKLTHAKKKIEQYKRSIGQHIAAIKKARPDDWEAIVKIECGLGRRSAYRYMALVDGTETV